MGLFSKRRTKGFDPTVWSDATDRSERGDEKPWFADVDLSEGDSSLESLASNDSARFDATDADWLDDDPGEQVRRRAR